MRGQERKNERNGEEEEEEDWDEEKRMVRMRGEEGEDEGER